MSSELQMQLTAWGIETAEQGDRYYRQGWVNTCCPMCQGPKKSLGFSEQWWNAHCWRCGKQNSWKMLQMLKPSLSRDDIAKAYAHRSTHRIDAELREAKPLGTYKTPDLTPLLPSHKHYLKARGFDPAMIEELWGISSTGPNARYENMRLDDRLFIPVKDHRLVESSWTTRAVSSSSKFRYFSAPESMERVSVKNLLYGLEWVRHTAIVVEGATDAWAVGHGAVATMGMVVSDSQIKQLGTIARRVILFDNSLAAQRRANALAAELGHYAGETIVAQLESGDDPAEANPSELQELRNHFLN